MHRIFLIFLIFLNLHACSQQAKNIAPIKCGAENVNDYLSIIKGKRIGIVANQSSRVGKQHLVDTLLKLDINIIRVFSPEHGFRGNMEDGALIGNETDKTTGIPVFSLYGKDKEMPAEQLKDIDIVILDLQDVGVRFYTFISTMHYVLKTCAVMQKKLIILDRPNPNGNYVDGPVLSPEFSSFIGLHPIPVVYGLTMGELAKMINGEGWLGDNSVCDLEVIPCQNYTHDTNYDLPVPPSPNLPNSQAVRLYPSLAFFEGTSISVGRGTEFPFQVFGHPSLTFGDFWFTPESRPGYSVKPPQLGEKCRGIDLRDFKPADNKWDSLNIEWLIKSYQSFEPKNAFFIPYFDKIAGTDRLRKDIEKGLIADEIRQNWNADLIKYKKIREKYLIYR